jgi:DNA-binding HxlR family transcriptional regulator
MFKKEDVRCVKFCRGSSPSIDVYLAGEVQPVSLFRDIVEHTSEALSEKEIEVVIHILTSKKRVMSMQRNFPQIYNKMLTELIEVQRKRYGKRVKKDKKRRLGYSVSGGKLEEILGEYANIPNVHIDSIYVGSNKYGVERIGSNVRHLVHLSFHEVKEDE